MRKTLWLPFALASVVLGGCETTPTKAPDEAVAEERVELAAVPEAEGEPALVRGLGATPGFKGHVLDDPASPLGKKIIYFDYDRSEILDQYRPIVEAHAAYLATQPGASVTLEGHTDERGSREYNLGLGERRSQAVGRVLVLLGAADEQIGMVSYGEEQPAADGHDESAWNLNRRVEIVYLVR